MSDSLFNQPEATTTPPVDNSTASIEAFANQLFAIKNDKGEPKYNSLTTALDALKHSQEYIPQLKTENTSLNAEVERLKAELAQRASLEEQLAKFTTTRQPEPATPTSEPAKAFDESALQEMVQRTLSQEQAKTVAASNIQQVRTALVSKFGEKAQEEVKARASELGLTMEQIDGMAASSPKALLHLFGASPASTTAAPVRSSVTLPETPRQEGVKHPGKSLLRGAKTKDVQDFMRQIKEEVYRENGIDL